MNGELGMKEAAGTGLPHGGGGSTSHFLCLPAKDLKVLHKADK